MKESEVRFVVQQSLAGLTKLGRFYSFSNGRVWQGFAFIAKKRPRVQL